MLTVPLTYDVPSATLHCPMVAAEVAGIATLLIVDTGATDHVLTVELARRAGLALADAPAGTDVTGADVPSWAVDAVDVRLGDETLVLDGVVAIEGPPPFAGWGVGGIVSPQRLAPHRTVVLDLLRQALTITDDRPVVEGVAVARHVAGTLGVVATMGRFGDAVALLDTGAAGSDVVAPLESAASTSGRGISGAGVDAVAVSDQDVVIAGIRRTVVLNVRERLAPPEDAAADEIPTALLGMDVLAGSLLVIPPAPEGITWGLR